MVRRLTVVVRSHFERTTCISLIVIEFHVKYHQVKGKAAKALGFDWIGTLVVVGT